SKVAVFVELTRNAALLRRQAEELERAEAGMRAVLEAAPDAMVILDAGQYIRRVNTEAERVFGYSRFEMLGKPMSILSPDWFTVRLGAPNEVVCRTKSGAMFPGEVSLKPVETGEAGLVVSVIRDITDRKLAQESARRVTIELERQVGDRTRELTIDIAERKRAEQALRESEQRLRVAIEAAQLGLWRLDMDCSRLHISPLCCELFELPAGTALLHAEEWKQKLHPEDRDAAWKEVARCASQMCGYEGEYRVAHSDGTVRWIFAKGQPFAGEDDMPLRVVGIAQDITHRKLAEDADRHRQKLESLGILAGGIAHDFNNLLTGILGNASLLLDAAGETPLNRQVLGDLVSAAERAAQLTRQMLAYSGRGKFVTQPMSVGEEAREIAALVRASIPRHVRVQFDIADDAPRVEGDKAQIHQLLMNLVINAAEAAGPGGGTVRIATRRHVLDKATRGFYPAEELPPGRYLVLEVEDDGQGMTEATRARIFDPFFTTKFTGRGLGLAAVLGIVRGHKGGIAVDSVPGLGTTFRVFLPASDCGPLSQHAKENAPQALAGKGTILIVDDELIVRNVAKHALERYGYRVLLADDGQAALDIFNAAPDAVSMVLLDMAMPGMGGAETLRHLRAARPELRVIASSGYSEGEAMERFGEGLAGFLQKPYAVQQLAAKVKEVLQIC
ncbi:MAG: PAS domain S-box protein, partial [Acidobacteriota bacterium]|nr:PAS domain S-box protein [Acidobacteriota bacterium]